ncbi:MAG: hypothetical protein CMH57_04285 [Myxococcales bacterium]|nr:hypothetical protein [Myxococcales bacterium]
MATTCVDTRSTSTRRPSLLWALGLTTVAALLAVAAPAWAADLTDVVDAAEEDDPFDIHIEPRFKSTLKRAKITREAPCNPNVTTDPLTGDQTVDRNSRLRYPRLVEAGRCAEPEVVYNKELRGWRRTDQIDVLGEIGLYKDVELHFTLPFILRDVRGVHFAGNGGDPTEPVVDTDNSSVDPSEQRIIEDIERNGEDFTTYRLFDARNGNEGPTRSGFGDMSIGLAWNPFNQERDDTKATLKLGFDYLIPTGTVAKGGNEGVGRGVHELQATIAASKRFKYIDPYFGITGVLPLAGGESLFQEAAPGQTLTQPGWRAEITFGSEFIPYEDLEKGNFFKIDLGFDFGYTAEGRDYSLMFDALAGSSCNGVTPREVREAIEAVQNGVVENSTVRTAACKWILDQPANAQNTTPKFDLTSGANDDIEFAHNGITDYEGFATFGLHLNLYLQVARYVQLKTRLSLQHQQEHFITAARTGKDSADDNDTVRFDNPDERNPYYNPTLDSVGNRFRVEETTIFTWSSGLAFQF